MKNLKFYLIIAALAIGLTFLAVKYFQKTKEVTAFEQSKADRDKQVLTEANEIKRAVNEKGIENVLFDITENHAPSKNKGSDTDSKDIIDTAAMALDISANKLKEVMVVNATIAANNIQLKEQLDSLKRRYYTFNGNGLHLRFTPPYDSTSFAQADFMGTLSLTAAQGYKKRWLLGKQKTLLSITSDNPYFHVSKVNYIGFDKEPLSLRLAAKGKIMYNRFAGPSAGPALNFNFGKVSLESDYQYYSDHKAWGWGATAAFTFGKL